MPNLTDVLVRERIAARRRVGDLSRRIARLELHIARDPKVMVRLLALEEERELACRDLVNLVDDSPERTRPKGWET